MSTLDPVRFLAKNMRVDLALIAGMIAPGARVLDIGCGDGTLIDHLFQTKNCDARGIEIDMAEVTRAVAHGLPVMHGDADFDLAHYPDGAFDYVVLSRALQAVERPRAVLSQMLRIGTRAVVSFPNFGHWLVRWQLLSTGRMPMTTTWDRPWHETPNIHPCTIRDFFMLCEEEGYVVERWLAPTIAGAVARGGAPGASPTYSVSRACSCCDADKDPARVPAVRTHVARATAALDFRRFAADACGDCRAAAGGNPAAGNGGTAASAIRGDDAVRPWPEAGAVGHRTIACRAFVVFRVARHAAGRDAEG